jgi:hypothetical protein
MTKWWTIYRYVQQVKPKSEDDPIKWRDPPQNGAQCILRHDSRLEPVYVFSQTRLRMETIFIHCKRPIPKKNKTEDGTELIQQTRRTRPRKPSSIK